MAESSGPGISDPEKATIKRSCRGGFGGMFRCGNSKNERKQMTEVKFVGNCPTCGRIQVNEDQESWTSYELQQLFYHPSKGYYWSRIGVSHEADPNKALADLTIHLCAYTLFKQGKLRLVRCERAVVEVETKKGKTK